LVIYSINGCIFNTWYMAILAITLLGVGTFGMIAGVVSGKRLYKFGSAVLLLSGAMLGVICLINEGVL
jgi:hypothetical protein